MVELLVMAKEHKKKGIQQHLLEVRNDVILTLHKDFDYGATDIAIIMNRTKQLVSHVLATHRKKK